MPQNKAPLTFLYDKYAVRIKPKKASIVPMLLISPRETHVLSLKTTIPAFWSPIKAIKKPIPTLVACFNVLGIELKIISRTFTMENKIKIKPSINTAINAISQPFSLATVKAKYALSPIHGASAKG